jgi:hypothetical protein
MDPLIDSNNNEGQPEQPEQGPARVEGLDPGTVRLKRQYEAEVESKVASDYSHIVWAYGIIWALFAIYGAILWRRSAAQRADVEALEAKLRKP